MAATPSNPIKRALTWLTGAKEGEQAKVFLTFTALLCLLISYYLIKPLRNSQFLKDFHPSQLPLVYACVAFLSFSVTKIFSHLAKKVEKYRLVTGAYVAVIVCKLVLGNWLQTGGKPAVIVFYFFASVYFMLVLATLWACVNDMFTVEQGERCFGFVAVGSTLGSTAGSALSDFIAKSAYSGYALYFSIMFLILALVFVMSAARMPRSEEGEALIASSPTEGSKNDFWGELRALATQPFLRRVGLTVLLLGIATTAIEFVSQATIDRELARNQYNQSFSDLQSNSFEEIYGLKTQGTEERESSLLKLAQANSLSLETMKQGYENYRNELELKTRSFFSTTYLYQSLAGIISLMVVARFLFPRVGMRFCFIILPCVAIFSLCLFGLTVDLLLVQGVLVLVGACNYSLNNAAKEILYTATNEEALFRFKPMIEGPGMRASDLLASILKLSVQALAAAFVMAKASENYLFLCVTILFLLIWVRSAWLAGKQYDDAKKAGIID